MEVGRNYSRVNTYAYDGLWIWWHDGRRRHLRRSCLDCRPNRSRSRGYLALATDLEEVGKTFINSTNSMENTANLSPRRVGIALSGALLVAFVLCAIAQVILPGVQFSHMWLALFTAAPLGSVQAWIEGIIASVIVGFILGLCFGHCYNWSGKHGIK